MGAPLLSISLLASFCGREGNSHKQANILNHGRPDQGTVTYKHSPTISAAPQALWFANTIAWLSSSGSVRGRANLVSVIGESPRKPFSTSGRRANNPVASNGPLARSENPPSSPRVLPSATMRKSASEGAADVRKPSDSSGPYLRVAAQIGKEDEPEARIYPWFGPQGGLDRTR